MASASATEVFNCSKDDFFKIIADYEKYPEFLAEVKDCRVVETIGAKKKVEFTVSVIKSFSYELWMSETPTDRIEWDFAGGDLFKRSSGSWVLEDQAGKTKATYTVEADFKMFVPGPVAKTLISVNLPNMMSAYHKRVSELYGQ
jgi:ribosome-associated toxin RatA of RatAB toxin-antitoxin module